MFKSIQINNLVRFVNQIGSQRCLGKRQSTSSANDSNLSIPQLSKSKQIGFIGLGNIGFAMASNFSRNGYQLLAFDQNKNQSQKLYDRCQEFGNVEIADTSFDIAKNCDIIVSVLPNDKILKSALIESNFYKECQSNSIHMSCATISPHTAREISDLFFNFNKTIYVSSPVFARPDGMAKAQATIPVSCANDKAREMMKTLLSTTASGIYDFGNDPGAANVVKLCGNFMIACAIESISESMSLGECNGIDRKQLMSMLSETIFDCLIYKGYGQRVSERDHTPYNEAHFALELGHKDVNLMLDTANKSNTPMPFANVLHDRYLSAMSKKRNDLDWSAIGLNASEDVGIDVKDTVQQCRNRALPNLKK